MSAANQYVDPTPVQPYLAGEHVHVLYMSERGTVLADAHVTAVFPRPDGTYRIDAVLSDAAVLSEARASSDRLAAAPPVPELRSGRVIYGVDHTKSTE